MKAFIMTPDVACKIFEAFIMAEAVKLEERYTILAKFVLSGEVDSLDVNASKEELVTELAKMFNVWQMGRKEKDNG